MAIDQSAGQADAHDRDRRDREACIALWAHQIKVPLAAMRMLLQSEPGPASDRLTAELFKVEQYVEMLLGYQRLTGPSTDFTLRQCDVNAVMRASARRFAPLFIEKKLRLNYQETTLRALTDEKWLAFVLEQVLSNAVKYTRRGSVTIRADESSHAVSWRTRARHRAGGPPRVLSTATQASTAERTSAPRASGCTFPGAYWTSSVIPFPSRPNRAAARE